MATCIENCRHFPFSTTTTTTSSTTTSCSSSSSFSSDDIIWDQIRSQALSDISSEPLLQPYYTSLILSHPSLDSALSHHLASKLSLPPLLPPSNLSSLFLSTLSSSPSLRSSLRSDLSAALHRDPACLHYLHCFLHFKGFLALQAHRIAHHLFTHQRRPAPAFLIQGRVSEVFSVDIHPGARIGSGVLLDHGTGIVIGETAVIGDDVSILHNVTLGGTGKESGDRHPKIGDGVLVGAGTQILGSVRVGEGAKIGAGSVVLRDVPEWTTAVGNPARLIGGRESPVRSEGRAGLTMDHTSWSDYVI